MGRITAYDQDGRMADFDKSGYDLMWMRQGYEDEIEHLMSENARLFTLLKHESEQTEKLRELAKKLVILAFARCADCDLLDASCALVPTQKCLLWNECESIAHELGVEVDDA